MNVRKSVGIMIGGLVITAGAVAGGSTVVTTANSSGGESMNEGAANSVAAKLMRKPPIPVCPDCRGGGKTR